MFFLRECNVLRKCCVGRQYDPKLDYEQQRQLALRGKAFDELPSFKDGLNGIQLPSAEDA